MRETRPQDIRMWQGLGSRCTEVTSGNWGLKRQFAVSVGSNAGCRPAGELLSPFQLTASVTELSGTSKKHKKEFLLLRIYFLLLSLSLCRPSCLSSTSDCKCCSGGKGFPDRSVAALKGKAVWQVGAQEDNTVATQQTSCKRFNGRDTKESLPLLRWEAAGN